MAIAFPIQPPILVPFDEGCLNDVTYKNQYIYARLTSAFDAVKEQNNWRRAAHDSALACPCPDLNLMLSPVIQDNFLLNDRNSRSK
jgi:hypothetical protein